MGKTDYEGARKIVNGTDKADMIAAYARQFELSLKLIGDEPEVSKCPLKNPDCPRNQ